MHIAHFDTGLGYDLIDPEMLVVNFNISYGKVTSSVDGIHLVLALQ